MLHCLRFAVNAHPLPCQLDANVKLSVSGFGLCWALQSMTTKTLTYVPRRISPRVAVNHSEGLAYLTVRIIGTANSLATALAKFEQMLADPSMSNFKVERQWLIIWDAYKTAKTKVIVYGQGQRNATKNDLQQLELGTGISLDWNELAAAYTRLARKKGRPEFILPRPNDAVLAKYQQAYFRKQERLLRQRMRNNRCK